MRHPCKETPERVAAHKGLSEIPYCEPCRNRDLQIVLDRGAAREGAMARSAAEEGASASEIDEVRAKAREQLRAETLQFVSMFPEGCATDRKA